MNKLKKWRTLPHDVKRMLLEAFALSAQYRLKIFHRPFSELSPKIGVLGLETAEIEQDNTLCQEVQWVVDAICRRTPWESKCLVRALTAKKLLNRRGLPCTLYMGVAMGESGEMVAHAWLRCGTMYVSGGYGAKRYAVTTIYGDKEKESEHEA